MTSAMNFNNMKKLLLLLLSLVVLSSCDKTNTIIRLKEGDTRITVTEHYIYVEKCTFVNMLNQGIWEYEKVINRDSIKYIHIGDL